MLHLSEENLSAKNPPKVFVSEELGESFAGLSYSGVTWASQRLKERWPRFEEAGERN